MVKHKKIALSFVLSIFFVVGNTTYSNDSTSGEAEVLAASRLLRDGDVANAEKLLKVQWEKLKKQPSANKARVAFYLGLCSELQENLNRARSWYRKAFKSALPGSSELALFYVAGLKSKQIPQALIASSDSNVGLREYVLGGIEKNDVRVKHIGILKQANKELRNVKAAYETKKDINGRISYAVWSLIFAELAHDDVVALHETANTWFQTGATLYLDVEAELRKDKNAVQNLPTAVAMQLDATRVRLKEIVKKYEASREREKVRLSDLRDLVMKYRKCTEQLTLAMSEVLLKRHDESAAAIANAENQIDLAEKILKKRNPKDKTAKDYWLIESEPKKEAEFANKPNNENLQFFAKESLRGHFKAVEGMIAYRGASDDDTVAGKLLTKALQKGKESIDDDAGNVLGHYLLSIAYEAMGLTKTKIDPTDPKRHDDAKPSFEKSKEYVEATKNLLPMEAVKITKRLETMEAEQDASTFLQYAETAIFPEPNAGASSPKKAVKELKRGLQRHSNKELLFAKFKMALRAGHPAKELRAEFNRTITKAATLSNTYEMQLILGMIVLADIQEHMKKISDKSAHDDLQRMVKMREADQAFTKAKMLADTVRKKAICSSYLAYATAIQAQIRPEDSIILQQAEKSAFLSATTLEGEGKITKGKKELKTLDLYDALIANYLAQGHLAIQLERDYELGAVPPFALAVQQAAELPYGSHQWEVTMGAPLLKSIARRKEFSALKYARKERNLRGAMTYFVDGAYALHWKQFDTAAMQMEKGLGLLAREEKDISDWDFTSESYRTEYRTRSEVVKDDLIALNAIARVEDGKVADALVSLLRWVLPKMTPKGKAEDVVEKLTPNLIREALKKASSPLVKYALGVALEKRTVDIGKFLLSKSDVKMIELKHKEYQESRYLSVNGLLNLKAILANVELEKQYAPVMDLTLAALDRLTSGNHFVEKAKTLRKDNHLTGAAATLKAGLARQINNAKLWGMLLSVTSAELSVIPEPDKKIVDEADRLIHLMEFFAPEKKYEVLFWHGELLARMGDNESAVSVFQKAAVTAQTNIERTRALARAVELKQRR